MTDALRLQEFGAGAGGVALVEGPEPSPGPGEVLVEIEAASVNPSDLRLIAGTYGVRPPLPAPLGTEGVGRVRRIGSGVDPALDGRRVVVVPGHAHGTWATRAVVEVVNVVPVDDAADPLQLAMAGVNPVTALLLLRMAGELSPGEWVAQTGANSAVGQHVVRLARRAGLRTFNIVRRPEAARIVAEAGGDLVIVAGETSGSDAVDELAGRTFGVVLDSVGGPLVGELAHHLRDGGRVISYGAISGEPVALAVREDIVYRDVSHHGFWIVNWLRSAGHDEIAATYREVVDLVAAGTLRATVDGAYRLEEYRTALDAAAGSRRGGKILFAMSGAAVGATGPGRSEATPTRRPDK